MGAFFLATGDPTLFLTLRDAVALLAAGEAAGGLLVAGSGFCCFPRRVCTILVVSTVVHLFFAACLYAKFL